MMQMVFLLVLEAAVMLGPLGWYHVSGMKVKDFKFWANKPIRYTAGQDEGALANVTGEGMELSEPPPCPLCTPLTSRPPLNETQCSMPHAYLTPPATHAFVALHSLFPPSSPHPPKSPA